MTAKFKRRRLWIVHVSPLFLFWAALITVPYLLPYLARWRWTLPLVLLLIVFVSIQTVSFEVKGTVVFKKYVGFYRERRLELPVLELESFGDDWSGDEKSKEDHVRVGPGLGLANFACDRPAEVVEWITANLNERSKDPVP